MLRVVDIILNKRLKFILEKDIVKDIISPVVPKIGESVNIDGNIFKICDIIYNLNSNIYNRWYMRKEDIEYSNNYIEVYLKKIRRENNNE